MAQPWGENHKAKSLKKKHFTEYKKEKESKILGGGDRVGFFPSPSRNQSLSTPAKGHQRDSKAEGEAKFLQRCRPCCSSQPPVALRALIDAHNATNYKGKPSICLSVQV